VPTAKALSLVPLAFFLGRFSAAQGPAANPGRVDTLRSVGGLSADICNIFREPLGFQKTASGVYYVFDRRGHTVYSIDPEGRSARKVVEIGSEGGRVLEPTAFDLAPDGTFVVADAPRGRERLQVFDFAGNWIAGFTLPGKANIRITIGGLALGGVSTLALLGNLIALNQPETGSLITEYNLTGTPLRSIGALRPTGHENDRQLHFAMNTGIPIRHPAGGYYFVFFSGSPVLRRYDAKGALMFERVIQGRELDPVLENMPMKWPRRTVDGTEVPLVVPIVRAAAVDANGNLWVSFLIPFTYVYDSHGEKVRTVQFRGAGIVSPTSLFFTQRDELLVTPGCYAFGVR